MEFLSLQRRLSFQFRVGEWAVLENTWSKTMYFYAINAYGGNCIQDTYIFPFFLPQLFIKCMFKKRNPGSRTTLKKKK